MAYSTQEDILKRIRKRELDKLIESLDGEPDSADILTEAISTADSIIDGYLKSVVKALPLTEVTRQSLTIQQTLQSTFFTPAFSTTTCRSSGRKDTITASHT